MMIYTKLQNKTSAQLMNVILHSRGTATIIN